jgi:hypothetical protein
MVRVFTRIVQRTGAEESSLFLYYFFFAFGVPILIVAATKGTNAVVYNGTQFGYGGDLCFLSNKYSLGFGFVLPVAAIIVSNALLFTVTAYKIGRSPAVQSSNTEPRRNLVIYAKLITLTGLTWIVVIIDAMFDVSVLSFVATFLVGCQGVFIFLSYMCNRRVYKMYRKLCQPNIDHPLSTTDSTIINTLTISKPVSLLAVKNCEHETVCR